MAHMTSIRSIVVSLTALTLLVGTILPSQSGFARAHATMFSDGTLLGDQDTGRPYRVAGGAPLLITDCAPLNNCVGRINVSDGTIASMQPYPADGTFLGAADSGRTYEVAGGAPLLITSCNVVNNCAGRVDVTQGTIDQLDHLNAVPINGTILGAADSGRSYVVAGGTPLYVTSCTPLNNCVGRVNITQGTIDQLDHLNARPTDGTFLGAADSGRTYEVAGGAPLFITSCNVVNNCAGRVNITQGTIDQLDHLNAVPADGTFVRAADTGGIYRVAGGAPLHITDCGPFGGPGGCDGAINVNQATIDHLSHMWPVPGEGTLLHAQDTGTDYHIVGGAPVHITDCGQFNGCARSVAVNQATVDTHDHMLSTPVDSPIVKLLTTFSQTTPTRTAAPANTVSSNGVRARAEITIPTLRFIRAYSGREIDYFISAWALTANRTVYGGFLRDYECSIGGCEIWDASLLVNYSYNYVSAWATHIEHPTQGTGYDVSSQAQCYTIVVGTQKTYACTLRFTVAALIHGFPLHADHGFTDYIYPNGGLARANTF